MKLFSNLCGIALAGILGYALEPNLRVVLTGQALAKPDISSNSRILVQRGLGAEKLDLESLTSEQLPEMVRISTGLKVEDSATGITMNIPAGNNVKLVSIDGTNAVVSQGGSYVGSIPLMDTDLLQRLAEMPATATPAPAPAPAPAAPEPESPATVETAEPPAIPEPPTVPDPTPEPEIVVPDPTSTPPEPAPAVEPAVPSEPATPAGELAVPATPTSQANVVQVMQASVKSGQIKEFKLDQVTEWKAGQAEEFEGEMFQTGTALYKAVTFLGEKTIEAKAFIKDGKVQRWIWPRSNMEIK
jgi:hypothetical protein